MSEGFYTVDQVAALLGLHVKTVRGYVRDGRLVAKRIGKSYRIAAADLATFTGSASPPPSPDAVVRRRPADVTAVVRLHAVTPAETNRLTSLITAVRSQPPSEPLQIQADYDEEYAAWTVVLTGGLNRTADTLKAIDAVVSA
jgi:excisionase family DNA binding protein